MNRRELIIGIGLAGATAAVPVSGSTITKAQPDRRAWNAALARYRAADAAFDDAWTRMEEAEEAVFNAVPRVDRFFDDYRLGRGMKRDSVEFWLRQYVARTGNQIDIDAEADAFEAREQAHREAEVHFGSKVLEAEAKALRSVFFECRDTLMGIAAPDKPALLVKMEIAAMSLDDEHAESTLTDGRRLLAGEA